MTASKIRNIVGTLALVALVATIIAIITTMGEYNVWTSIYNHIGNIVG